MKLPKLTIFVLKDSALILGALFILYTLYSGRAVGYELLSIFFFFSFYIISILDFKIMEL